MLATLRQRNFALLWVAGLVSIAGDWMLIAALPVHIYERTGSTLAAGLLWLVYPLSGLLIGSMAGVFVDRWDRRRTMVAVCLLQAAVIPFLLLGLRNEWLWVIYAVAFAEGALATFFYPAENALLPRLVGEEGLMTANALNSLNDNLGRIVGSAVGGLLLTTTGIAGVVLVDAASYLVAALLIALIALSGVGAAPAAGRSEVVDTVAAGWTGVWGEWVAGLRLIRSNQFLQALLLVVAVGALADSLNSPLIVPFILEVVAGGSALFGLVLAVRGVAGLLGGIVIGRFGQQFAPPRLLGWSMVCIGIGFLVIVNVPLIPVILIVQLALGPAIAGWLASQQTLLQTAAEDAYRGRIFGAVGTTTSLMALIGIGLGSALGDVVGIVPLFNLSALLYAGAGVLALALLQAVSPLKTAPES